MHKSVERDLITCGEAAGILGITLQAVHQGLRRGTVRFELVNGRRMIERDRLVQRWKGVSDEEVLAARCNAMLDCSAWGPPPWSGAQWQTLSVVVEMAG
jgi:hypothetical protein